LGVTHYFYKKGLISNIIILKTTAFFEISARDIQYLGFHFFSIS